MRHVSDKYRKRSWEEQETSDFNLAGGSKESRSAASRKKESSHFQLGLFIALFFLSVLFYSAPKLHKTELILAKIETPIIVTPPVTVQKKIVKPPPVKIPVASEEDDVPEDLEIDYTIFEWKDLTDIAPPEPEEVEEVVYVPFWKLARKPEVIKKIQPVYPPLAMRAGISGTVICEIAIGKTGKVEDAKIIKSIPYLDDAALKAVRQWVFSPGLQRDNPVRVKMSIPVMFTLN